MSFPNILNNTLLQDNNLVKKTQHKWELKKDICNKLEEKINEEKLKV